MNTNFNRWSGVAGVLNGMIVVAGAFMAESLTDQYLLLTGVTLVGQLLVRKGPSS